MPIFAAKLRKILELTNNQPFLLVFFHIWSGFVVQDFFDVLIHLSEFLLAESDEFLGLFQVVGQGVDVHLSALDFTDDGFEAVHGFGVGEVGFIHNS